MSSHLNRLLASCQKFPQLLPWIKRISSTHGFIINNPIQIIKNSKGYGLEAIEHIKQNSNIVHISSQKCLSSHYFAGSTTNQNNKFAETLQRFQTLKGERDVDILKTCKVALQLLVNLKTPEFGLHEYAKFLQNYESPSFRNLTTEDIQLIQSQRLLSIIYNSQKKLDEVAVQFHQKFPFVTPELFLKMYVITRSRALKINNEMVLCPLLDMINHSYEPNCQVIGKYMANDSFVTLKALKDISRNEELTIQYGEMSNNELYFKYNFVVGQNPHSFYLARLNYDDYEEDASNLFDTKLPLFEKLGGIPEIVKVFRTKIDEDSMAALRLYFLNQSDLSSQKRLTTESLSKMVSKANERKVLEFLLNNLDTSYRFMSQDGHPDKNIELMQAQEILILKDMMDAIKRQLKDL